MPRLACEHLRHKGYPKVKTTLCVSCHVGFALLALWQTGFVRPVLPGYKFVPCGFTRSFIVASVTSQLLVSAFFRRMSYVKEFGFYPIKPNNRSSRSFALLCFVSTWCQWYIVRQWCLDMSVIIYGFYFTVSFLAAWLRFQAPALYHPYAVSFMKPLLQFHLEGGLSSHLIPAAWLRILLRMFLWHWMF